MIYYIKQGQSSIFQTIKINGDECVIPEVRNNKKYERILKKMNKKNIKKVVLSKEIKEKQYFVERLNNEDVTILDGKWLMQYLLEEIIEYLIQIQKIKDIDEITILANDINDEIKLNIKKFMKKCKRIRIVTNHIKKFKRIEEELYEQTGIPIIITNNKRKALVKSNIIINFDFVQEGVNQYNINENATIINLSDKIKINTKRYVGTIITDYEVEIENRKEYIEVDGNVFNEIGKLEKDYSLKEIIEEKIYSDSRKYIGLETIEERIKKYKIKIKELYGISGKIV